MVVLPQYPPTDNSDPLREKAVEYDSGVSVSVIHGDGVGGALAPAGCERAWEIRSSKFTQNTFLDDTPTL